MGDWVCGRDTGDVGELGDVRQPQDSRLGVVGGWDRARERRGLGQNTRGNPGAKYEKRGPKDPSMGGRPWDQGWERRGLGWK